MIEARAAWLVLYQACERVSEVGFRFAKNHPIEVRIGPSTCILAY
jgi:hypothetical protein